MTTFSQLVDSIIVESRRPDLRSIIASQLNLTVRELHAHQRTGVALTFGANLKEMSILAESESGFVWKFPRPHLFQNLEAVYYPEMGVIPKQRYPGSAMAYLEQPDGIHYFYRTGDSIAFSGYGGEGAAIYLAWYERLSRLTYIPKPLRQVEWDEENEEWIFTPEVAGDPEAEAEAMRKSTHWMLQRYSDMLGQGARAKLFARLGDGDRARLSYSLYEQLRPNMVSAESFEFVPTWNR